jgi:SAM-dependent methyltransferase
VSILPDPSLRGLSDAESKSLRATQTHYRAFIGPPSQYDFMGGSQFSLLFSLGLREEHNVLDFGCGSLRAGRLLIPYLAAGRYFGIEPNAWLIEDAIERQIGADLMNIKQPRFSDSEAFNAEIFGVEFDFILAQSIFSHAGPDLLRRALTGFAKALRADGLIAATFNEGDMATPDGWFYGGLTTPGSVAYRPKLIARMADQAGLRAVPLRWFHRRQTWWLMGRNLPPPDDLDLLHGAVLRRGDVSESVDRARTRQT